MPAINPARTRDLCYRLTDQRVHKELGLVPLSVACDKLAYSALRCAGLLDDLGVVDRSGVDGVFEVHPAAALKAWGCSIRGTKASLCSPRPTAPHCSGCHRPLGILRREPQHDRIVTYMFRTPESTARSSVSCGAAEGLVRQAELDRRASRVSDRADEQDGHGLASLNFMRPRRQGNAWRLASTSAFPTGPENRRRPFCYNPPDPSSGRYPGSIVKRAPCAYPKESPMRQSLQSPAVGSICNESVTHGDCHHRDPGACRRR
jgi:hypothetical protein